MTGDTEASCPDCDGDLYRQNRGRGPLWCDDCEREYWREGDGWWSCDETGVPARV